MRASGAMRRPPGTSPLAASCSRWACELPVLHGCSEHTYQHWCSCTRLRNCWLWTSHLLASSCDETIGFCQVLGAGKSPGWAILQVMPAAMLWGAGTALGEIPPYAVAFHAAVASGKVSGMEEALAVRSRRRSHALASDREIHVQSTCRHAPSCLPRQTHSISVASGSQVVWVRGKRFGTA